MTAVILLSFYLINNINSKMSRNKTRTDNIDWLLGHGSDVSLSIGNKLPLQRAVMKRFLKLRQGEPRKSSRNLFTVILKELKAIWDRASIPILSDKKCIDYLLKIHNAWQLVKKIKINSRESEYSKEKITDFNLRMDQLCDLSPSELEKQMSSSRNPNWEEDYNFYIGQKNVPQTGFMQGVDQKNFYFHSLFFPFKVRIITQDSWHIPFIT